MRFTLLLNPNDEIVPFDYQQKLIGVLHGWLGENDLHDKLSLYSFSWLQNGKACKTGLDFPEGSKWLISFYNDQFALKVIKSIREQPILFCGISVTDIIIEEEDNICFPEDGTRFMLASPILIKRSSINGEIRFYTFKDKESPALLLETLKHKMAIAGLTEDNSLSVEFDMSYHDKKTKKVNIHGIENIANMCPVLIKGKEDSIKFARTVGIGNSTGSGFGSIY